jgi:hypothetical protein
LDDWDGLTPILLKLDLNRGEEHSIVSIAEFLSKQGAVIFTQFGVLSHPAMILREYGLQVFPLLAGDSGHTKSHPRTTNAAPKSV